MLPSACGLLKHINSIAQAQVVLQAGYLFVVMQQKGGRRLSAISLHWDANLSDYRIQMGTTIGIMFFISLFIAILSIENRRKTSFYRIIAFIVF